MRKMPQKLEKIKWRNTRFQATSQNQKGKPVRICKYEPRNQTSETTKDISKSLLIKNIDKSQSLLKNFINYLKNMVK